MVNACWARMFRGMDLARDTKDIKGDEGSIEQVIMNIVLNARDAMPKGGIIGIKTENVVIDEEYCKKWFIPGREISSGFHHGFRHRHG